MAVDSLEVLLDDYRLASRTVPERGTYFESLACAFLLHDPVQVKQQSSVEPYSNCANRETKDGRDVGIDLVAKQRNQDGYAAIQCKFYATNHTISKKDIDSFISASGEEPFRRRVIMDTTAKDWSEHAETMLRGQTIPTVGIGLNDLKDSLIRWDVNCSSGSSPSVSKPCGSSGPCPSSIFWSPRA